MKVEGPTGYLTSTNVNNCMSPYTSCDIVYKRGQNLHLHMYSGPSVNCLTYCCSDNQMRKIGNWYDIQNLYVSNRFKMGASGQNWHKVKTVRNSIFSWLTHETNRIVSPVNDKWAHMTPIIEVKYSYDHFIQNNQTCKQIETTKRAFASFTTDKVHYAHFHSDWNYRHPLPAPILPRLHNSRCYNQNAKDHLQILMKKTLKPNYMTRWSNKCRHQNLLIPQNSWMRITIDVLLT